MSSSILFLVGMAVTLASSVAIVIYLRVPLHHILAELCGTRERADFWAAVSNVTLVLLPLIFAMQYVPQRSTSPVIELATQLKWALIGVLAALGFLAIVLSRFIVRHRPNTIS